MSRFRTFAIVILAAALALATNSSASALPKTENLDSLGAVESNQSDGENLSAEAHAAERGDSSLVSVTWSIENNGASRVAFDWPMGATYMYSRVTSHSGVTALSPTEGTRFHPIMDSKGECLCSGSDSPDFKVHIEPGEKVTYWSMFSIPDNINSIDLEIPGFDPIEDIPIS